jgi:hypothetical protein
MIIESLGVAVSTNSVSVQTKVRVNREEKLLTFTTQPEFANLLSSTADHAVIAMLIPAMLAGKDIQVQGQVSERLYYNLPRLQKVLSIQMPFLNCIGVDAPNLSSPNPSAAGVATGFSGGIDSFCVIAENHKPTTPSSYRLTHLLFNDVGSHGRGGNSVFRKRYERLLPSAERLGLPFVPVESNLDEFFSKTIHFGQTHTLRNASVALALQGGLSKFLYASAFGYKDICVKQAIFMAYCDPILLPLVSTESLEALSVGSEYSRVEKTAIVTDFAPARGTLDVCIRGQHTGKLTNCSTCKKCLRTLATLDILGKLENHAADFDLALYQRQRNIHLAKLLSSSDSLSREVVDLARERAYRIPMSSHLLHRTRTVWLARGLQKLFS